MSQMQGASRTIAERTNKYMSNGCAVATCLPVDTVQQMGIFEREVGKTKHRRLYAAGVFCVDPHERGITPFAR